MPTAFHADIGLLEPEALTLLYGEPVIYHCNYYNIFLQRTIEDAGEYIPAVDILTRGAVAVAYPMLRRLFEAHPTIREPETRLAVAADVYAQLGFGRLPTAGMTADGGIATTPVTHYSLAWQETWEQRDTPVDYFTCGYLTAALAAAHYRAPGSYAVTQRRCLSMGDPENEFEAVAIADFAEIATSPGAGVTVRSSDGRVPVATSVDAAAITEAIRGMPLVGNADGLIPAFGVYLTRHFANYFNYISYEAVRRLPK